MIDKRFTEKLLDRIAELSADNPDRLTEYLSTMEKTGPARQAKLRQSKRDDGLRRLELWTDDATIDALKERYPGPRGGIDWPALLEAALQPHHDTKDPDSIQR